MALLAVMAVSLSMLGLQSCVNEAYDLNKGIDTTINVDGNISLPIGSTEKIMIGDFLEIDGNSGLNEDGNGDYSLGFSGSPVTESVSVPAIDLPADNFLVDLEIQPVNIRQTVENAIDDFGEYQDIVNSYPLSGMSPVTFDDLLDGEQSSAMIDIDQEVNDIAATVSEIGSVYLDAPVKLAFSFNSADGKGIITVNKGLKVTFPDFLTISDIPDNFSITAENVLTLQEDVRLTSGLPLDISFNITEMDLEALKTQSGGTQGYVEDGGNHYIRIQQPIEIEGLVLEVIPEDFGETLGELPATISFDIDIAAEKMTVTGATMVLDPDITIEDQTVETGELPEFLTGDNMYLDVYNPTITLRVSNSTPVALAVTAKMQGYDENGNPTLNSPILIGSESEPIIIRNLEGGVTCNTTVCISRRAVDPEETLPVDEYYQNLVIDNLSEIIATMPHTIKIYDVTAEPYLGEGEKYTSVVFGSSGEAEYEFGFSYDICIPLSFGEGLAIEYPYDITGLNSSFNSEANEGSNMSVYVDNAVISMTFVNTLPLGMSVTASPIDTNGNVLSADSGIEVGISASDGSQANVAAGTLDNPSSSPVRITLKAAKDAVKNLDGFRLNIIGTSSEETAGIALNSNQYIQITGISLSFDGGLEMEL